MSEWQPIETAPRDRTDVLVLLANNSVRVARYVVGWATVPGGWTLYPTHWMPLPAPPATPSAEEGESDG